jgi:hypothetical protein
MNKKSESQVHAAERLASARDERDRRAEQHESARGSSTELPAFTELQAAEEQFAAREAWLRWSEAEY